MKLLHLTFINIACLLLISSCSIKPDQFDKQALKAEISGFMDNYATIVRNREMEKIAALYYDSGIVFSGDGYNEFISFDSIRTHYSRQSRKPINFKWDKTIIDPINRDLVLVTSNFYVNDPGEKDTSKFSYTGLLVKTNSGWRVKHEHESMR